MLFWVKSKSEIGVLQLAAEMSPSCLFPCFLYKLLGTTDWEIKCSGGLNPVKDGGKDRGGQLDHNVLFSCQYSG